MYLCVEIIINSKAVSIQRNKIRKYERTSVQEGVGWRQKGHPKEILVTVYSEFLVIIILKLGHERMSYYSNVRSNIECSNGNLDIQIKNN